MIAAVTGHRPGKLGGYHSDPTTNPTRAWVRTEIRRTLIVLAALGPLTAISGMALGADQIWAEEALDLGIPLAAYIPFEGQEARWPAAAQERYRAILARAAEVVVVCPGPYAGWKMQRRNEAMVDAVVGGGAAGGAAGVVVAVWNGTSGGTRNCVTYANQRRAPLYVLNPATQSRRWVRPLPASVFAIGHRWRGAGSPCPVKGCGLPRTLAADPHNPDQPMALCSAPEIGPSAPAGGWACPAGHEGWILTDEVEAAPASTRGYPEPNAADMAIDPDSVDYRAGFRDAWSVPPEKGAKSDTRAYRTGRRHGLGSAMVPGWMFWRDEIGAALAGAASAEAVGL